jgi:uncharacterized alkaline shock family protein YloU
MDAPDASAPILEQELGTLEVMDRVFHDIARRVAAETDGVAGLSKAPVGLFRRAAADGVEVERGLGEVAFSVNLIVQYDVSIPKVAAELRHRLMAATEQATGYHVRAVNVAIDRIMPPLPRVPDAPDAPADVGTAEPLPSPDPE